MPRPINVVYPSGFRFVAADNELFLDYLNMKVQNPSTFWVHHITAVENIYSKPPETLLENSKDRDRYFFEFLTKISYVDPSVKNYGKWRNDKTEDVCLDGDQLVVLGTKGSYAFFDMANKRTSYLMKEYLPKEAPQQMT